MKKRCAKVALSMIKDNDIVGLGGGSTIAHLIEYIKASNLKVKIVTPSYQSKQLCIQHGLEVIDVDFLDQIDIAFDGCDEVDYERNALKSGGGIHTQEKIIASIAKEYVLLVDESKAHETLTFEHPVVLETCKTSLSSVLKKICELGGSGKIRQSTNKDGGIISDQGLLLVDATFSKEDVNSVQNLHDALLSIVGVLEISLFCKIVTKVIIIKEEGFEII